MKSALKKNIFSCLFFISFISYSMGQQATIEGKVGSERTKETLIGVSVLAGDTILAATDTTGYFRLKLNEGSHRLRMRMIGFIEKNISVYVKANETKTLQVMLVESSSELGLVVVSAGKFE